MMTMTYGSMSMDDRFKAVQNRIALRDSSNAKVVSGTETDTIEVVMPKEWFEGVRQASLDERWLAIKRKRGGSKVLGLSPKNSGTIVGSTTYHRRIMSKQMRVIISNFQNKWYKQTIMVSEQDYKACELMGWCKK